MDTSIEPDDAYILQGAQDDVEFIKAEADHVNEVLAINDFLLKLRTHLSIFILQIGEKHGIASSVQQNIAEDETSCNILQIKSLSFTLT